MPFARLLRRLRRGYGDVGWARLIRGGRDIADLRYEPELGSPGPEQPKTGGFWDWAGPRLFGLAVMVIGVLPWLFLYGPISSLAVQSEWPTVRGEVVASRLGHYRATENTQSGYNLIVDFSYTVDGNHHVNDQRVDMGHISKGEADSRLARNRPGMPITVYYDPSKHGKSVIVPGGATRTFYGYTLLGFIVSFVAALTFLSPNHSGRLCAWLMDKMPG